jgi:multiple sugar transport system substrate-binding protein
MISSISDSELLEDYMPRALRAVSFYKIENDVVDSDTVLKYGFPQRVDTQAFLYNPSIADSKGVEIPSPDKPWTIDEFKTAITKLNDQSNPADKQFGFSFQDLPDSAFPLFYGNAGADFKNYVIDRVHIQIESEESINSLQFMYDIVNVNRLTPIFADQGSENTIKGFLTAGNISSTFGYAAEMKSIFSRPTVFDDPADIGIARIPQIENGTGAPLETIALMINSQSSSEEKETAIELAQYLSSLDAQIENAANEYLLPSISKAYDDGTIKNDLIIKNYKLILQDARELPISKYWNPLIDGASIEIGEMLNGDQNGTVAARAIGIRWSFILPSVDKIPPIQPVGVEAEAAESSPGLVIGLALFSIASIVIVKRKRRRVNL